MVDLNRTNSLIDPNLNIILLICNMYQAVELTEKFDEYEYRSDFGWKNVRGLLSSKFGIVEIVFCPPLIHEKR